jgi:hypothetical protein
MKLKIPLFVAQSWRNYGEELAQLWRKLVYSITLEFLVIQRKFPHT